MDVREHNRAAWNKKVEQGDRFTRPVAPAVIARARAGQVEIYLTPTKPVPAHWLGERSGKRVLCLASGGGQQGPILAAAGARVTVFDNSPAQLAQDRLVAERESLTIRTVEGDMRDLSALADCSFDLIVHPVSNTFVPDVRAVWREAFRVLCPGGALLSGFTNPAVYLFDREAAGRGELVVRNTLPYCDSDGLPEEELQRRRDQGCAVEYSHTLETQIGGQIDAGFVLTGFYEDHSYPDENDLLDRYMPIYIATRAAKPASHEREGHRDD